RRRLYRRHRQRVPAGHGPWRDRGRRARPAQRAVQFQARGARVMSMFTLTERSPQHRAYQIIGWAIGIGIIIYLPYQSGQVPRIDQYSQVAAIAVAILGLNLVIGYSGVISLGQSAFVGIGAYTTVILVADHDWSYFATLPVAFAICF